MPTFQRRDTVCAALHALNGIEYPAPVEVIVVIDGSTDGTFEAIEEIQPRFARQVVIQPNSGAAAARNRGARLSSGEILLFLDDDMMAHPDLLSAHARRHLAGADAVIGDIPLDPASPDTFISRAVADWAEGRKVALAAGADLTLFDLLTGQLSVKRPVFEKLGGFDSGFTRNGRFGNEDIDFGVRLLEQHRLEFEPEAVSWQRYVVSPAAYFGQWYDAGRADVSFAAKHPGHAATMFDLHDRDSRTTRWLLRPLARLPFARTLAARLATALLGLPVDRGTLAEKMVARIVVLARDLGYWAGVADAGGIPDGQRITVLCFHALQDLSADKVLAPYGIPAGQFAGQLDDLERRGFHFARPRDIVSCLDGTARLPRKTVLVTFDDCYVELLDAARDLLRPRGIHALAFAVSGLSTDSNEWDQEQGRTRLETLSAAGLVELEAMGSEIGCHSASHRELTRLDDAGLVAETGGASTQLVAKGLRRPRYYAYPYGEHDQRSRDAVAREYIAAFGLGPGRVRPGADRYALPRIEILAQDSGWRFYLKTTFPILAKLVDRIP